MYQLGNIVYLSEEENNKVKENELHLTNVNHVKTEEEVPLEEYPFKYTIGKDIEVF